MGRAHILRELSSWLLASTYMNLSKSTPSPGDSVALHECKNWYIRWVRLYFLRDDAPTRISCTSPSACRPAGGGLLLCVHRLYVGLHT